MGPSLISKVTTFLQISMVILFLLSENYIIPAFVYNVLIYTVVVFTVISGTHYIFIGARILNEKKNH
jgi:phosphatidylglycerophosphate synthase